MKDEHTVLLRVNKTDRNAFKVLAAKAGKSMIDLFKELVKGVKK